MPSQHSPDDFRPVHPGTVIPHTAADFDFGTKIDLALADTPPQEGAKGQTAQYYYDTAVREWLRRILQVDGSAIPVVMASPSNAFATYSQMLKAEGKTICAGQPEMLTLPLPMASIQSGAYSPRAGSNPFPVRNMGFVDDRLARRASAQYGVTYTRYPQPVTFPYTITLWAQHKSSFHWMIQRLNETFWDYHTYFRVETMYLEKEEGLVTAAKRTGAEDLSDLERGTEERRLRYELRIEVEGWIFFNSLLAPTVHRQSHEVLTKDLGESNADAVTAFVETEALTGVAKTALHLQSGALEPSTDGV